MTATSRLARIQDGVRPEMKARLMLAGPAGAGKTRTALMIADILAPGVKPLVIDTEQESALTYADSYSFRHLAWEPPFDPQELADTIDGAAREHEVIIVDSASHFWSDDGGTLDMANGRYTGWKAARPAQRDLISAVLRAPAHMIVCVRSKMDHAQELVDGAWTVTKLGMAPIQDSTFEYEMNVSAELDMTHRLSISKTRCDVLDGREFTKGEGHIQEFATLYAGWLKGGEPIADQVVIDDLAARMNAITDEAQRKDCKRGFLDRFGRPEHLFASRVADAEAHVASYEQAADVEPDPDPEPPEKLPVPVDDAAEPATPPINGHAAPPAAPELVSVSSRLAGVQVSSKQASKLHADVANLAKALGLTRDGSRPGTVVADAHWSEGTLDALVHSASNGRSDSAGELTVDELHRVELYMASLAAGDMTSLVEENGNVRLTAGDQVYRFVRTPEDGLVHIGSVAS